MAGEDWAFRWVWVPREALDNLIEYAGQMKCMVDQEFVAYDSEQRESDAEFERLVAAVWERVAT